MATTALKPIPDDRLDELLGLIEQADTVELKLTADDSDTAAAGARLGVDALDGQIRQVFFFDTPDLALDKSGVVVRARRVQRKGDDSVVKLRPLVPDALPKRVRRSEAFGVEVDAMPGGFVCSGTMKRALPEPRVRAAVLGERRIRSLFSKEQRAFYAEHAPAGIELDDLSILGPIFVLKLKWTPEGLDRRLVAEMWLYPDGSRIIELSTKCLPGEAFQVAAETKGYLASHEIEVAAHQQTKTRKALEFFSARIGEA